MTDDDPRPERPTTDGDSRPERATTDDDSPPERATTDDDSRPERPMSDDSNRRPEQRATDQTDQRWDAPQATPDDGSGRPHDDGSVRPPAEGGTVTHESVTEDPAGDAEAVEPPDEPEARRGRASEDQRDGFDEPDVETIRQYLLKGALGLLVLVGVVATFRFYASATEAIDVLVAEQFQPIFQAVFNLILLLAVGIAIVQVIRKLE